MGLKYVTLNDSLFHYLIGARSGANDTVLQQLRAETDALGEISQMQISEEQGAFMGLLVAAIGAASAIEVGTFTGYSSLCIARGLPANGRLICLDESREWTNVASRYWAKAGVASRIELRLGAAIPQLQRLEPGLTFDFAFIDADKTQYGAYYEAILKLLRPGGLMTIDNVLWSGAVADGRKRDADTVALRALNEKLKTDKRISLSMLPIGDGLTLARKR